MCRKFKPICDRCDRHVTGGCHSYSPWGTKDVTGVTGLTRARIGRKYFLTHARKNFFPYVRTLSHMSHMSHINIYILKTISYIKKRCDRLCDRALRACHI